MSYVKELITYAKKAGVELDDKGNGHYQIKGALLVNYYPDSSKRTAYVAGTTGSKKHVTPAEAVKMALQPPPFTTPVKRKNNRKIKLRMLKKSNKCYWCLVILTEETATVDHVIPLARGGLDNSNNRVLACDPCNHDRGCNMPEVKEFKCKV